MPVWRGPLIAPMHGLTLHQNLAAWFLENPDACSTMPDQFLAKAPIGELLQLIGRNPLQNNFHCWFCMYKFYLRLQSLYVWMYNYQQLAHVSVCVWNIQLL